LLLNFSGIYLAKLQLSCQLSKRIGNRLGCILQVDLQPFWGTTTCRCKLGLMPIWTLTRCRSKLELSRKCQSLVMTISWRWWWSCHGMWGWHFAGKEMAKVKA